MNWDQFIERWRLNEGGAERANYALFLLEFCALLEVPHPDPASTNDAKNNYIFERSIRRKDSSLGRIYLYKRDCFVLEAKQSRQRQLRLDGTPNEKYIDEPAIEEGRLRG